MIKKAILLVLAFALASILFGFFKAAIMQWRQNKKMAKSEKDRLRLEEEQRREEERLKEEKEKKIQETTERKEAAKKAAKLAEKRPKRLGDQ